MIFDLAREQRAALLEFPQHVAAERGVLLQVLDQPAIARAVAAPHERLQERQVLGRVEERVPLDQLPLVPEQAVELGRVVPAAEPAPEDEMRRRRDRGDRVELEETEPPDGLLDAVRAAVEELRADGDAARLLERRLGQRSILSTPIARASRSSARSNAEASARERRTPGSRWNAFTRRTLSLRSVFRSARPTSRSPYRNGST